MVNHNDICSQVIFLTAKFILRYEKQKQKQ